MSNDIITEPRFASTIRLLSAEVSLLRDEVALVARQVEASLGAEPRPNGFGSGKTFLEEASADLASLSARLDLLLGDAEA